jgi:brefeldin A-resistance guanine nucleotide exchange factor 1
MALSAVLKVLKHGLVSEANPDAAEAMRAVADAVTLCRFEATDPDRDDVVLSKILRVLLECVTCPTGHLLGDDDVCNVVQACYRIGHQSGKESALLRDLSRHALREIVRVTFGRLPMLESVQPESTGAPTRAHIEGYVAAKDAGREAEEKEDGRSEKGADADPSADPSVDPSADLSADPSVGDSGTPKSPTKGPGADARAAAGAEEVVGGGEVADALEAPSREPFGLACVLEIFRFAVSFVGFEE